MIKIPGLSESEVIEIITMVVKNHRNKVFGIYEQRDIEQEAWIIALEKMHNFNFEKAKQKNIKKAFECWLNTVISNRLTNLFRDKYIVPQRGLKSDKSEVDQTKRVNLMHPIDISSTSDSTLKTVDFIDFDGIKEIVSKLDNDNLDILDSILSGEKINCYYRNKLLKSINKIKKEIDGRQ